METRSELKCARSRLGGLIREAILSTSFVACLCTVSLSDPSLWHALTHRHDLLPSQARSRKDTTRHIVQSWWRSSELFMNRCSNGRTPRIGHGTQRRQRMRVYGVDTCEAAVTKLTAASIAGFAISDGCISRTTSAGGPAGCFDSCSTVARSGCTDASRDRSLAYTDRSRARKRYQSRETKAQISWIRDCLENPDFFDGSTGWKDWSVVFRSYACACSAQLGSLLERSER